MEAELDKILEEREGIFQLQVDRWSKDGASWSSYRSGVSAIRNFLQKRNPYAISYLCSYFGISEAYLMSISGNYINADFLESRAVLKINGTTVNSGWNVKFDKSYNLEVTATAKEGYVVNAIVFTDFEGNSTGDRNTCPNRGHGGSDGNPCSHGRRNPYTDCDGDSHTDSDRYTYTYAYTHPDSDSHA